MYVTKSLDWSITKTDHDLEKWDELPEHGGGNILCLAFYLLAHDCFWLPSLKAVVISTVSIVFCI